MTPRPSTSTLFPYTTLFRSQAGEQVVGSGQVLVEVDEVGDRDRGGDVTAGRAAHRSEERREGKSVDLGGRRSMKKKNTETTRERTRRVRTADHHVPRRTVNR